MKASGFCFSDRDGQIFTFAAQGPDIFTAAGLGPYRRESGQTFAEDLRQTEWAGATFSPDGEWLFVDREFPGITFAITGPWSWLKRRKTGSPTSQLLTKHWLGVLNRPRVSDTGPWLATLQPSHLQTREPKGTVSIEKIRQQGGRELTVSRDEAKNIKTFGDRFVLPSMEQVRKLRENLPSWSGLSLQESGFHRLSDILLLRSHD